MSTTKNKVTLIANVGKVETRTMQSGDQVMNLSVATSETWKDKETGERQERTEWHKVVIYNQGIITGIGPYITKGDKLYIEGQLETRKWQERDTGAERYTTEIVLRPFRGDVSILISKKDAESPAETEQEEVEAAA